MVDDAEDGLKLEVRLGGKLPCNRKLELESVNPSWSRDEANVRLDRPVGELRLTLVEADMRKS